MRRWVVGHPIWARLGRVALITSSKAARGIRGAGCGADRECVERDTAHDWRGEDVETPDQIAQALGGRRSDVGPGP